MAVLERSTWGICAVLEGKELNKKKVYRARSGKERRRKRYSRRGVERIEEETHAPLSDPVYQPKVCYLLSQRKPVFLPQLHHGGQTCSDISVTATGLPLPAH